MAPKLLNLIGVTLRVLSLGRHRLNISIRIDHELEHPGERAAAAYEQKRLRAEARAMREHWEHEMISKINWIQ